MTTSKVFLRRTGMLLSAVAIAAAALAGCSNNSPKEEVGSPVTTTVNPMGPNSFAPGVVAPPAPTAMPGNHNSGN